MSRNLEDDDNYDRNQQYENERIKPVGARLNAVDLRAELMNLVGRQRLDPGHRVIGRESKIQQSLFHNSRFERLLNFCEIPFPDCVSGLRGNEHGPAMGRESQNKNRYDQVTRYHFKKWFLLHSYLLSNTATISESVSPVAAMIVSQGLISNQPGTLSGVDNPCPHFYTDGQTISALKRGTMDTSNRCLIAAGVLVAIILLSFRPATAAESVVHEWYNVKTPPPPELKSVTVDPRMTALLVLDFNKQTCSSERRPRCIESIPAVRKLLSAARSSGVPVIYSLSAGAAPADIAKELSPDSKDPIVTSGPDKFLGTDLEKILREKKIETVIVTGTAAHGAVLYTASAAALRGMKVIVPVDAISAETLYPEQYTVWHLVNAPRISAQVILSTINQITISAPK